MSLSIHALAGATASVVAHLIIYPLDVLRTRLQCEIKDDRGNTGGNGGRGNTGSIESPSCPNPMPMYSEYVVKNNVVILCEVVKSSMKGSKIKADSTSFCDEIAKKLESNQ